MRAEVAAIAAELAPLGMPVHWLRVDGTLAMSDYPYVLLWQSTGRPFFEAPLDGANEAIDAHIGVTVVGTTVAQAETKARLVKGVLTPGGRALDLTIPGRIASIRWAAFSVMQEDRDAPLPGLATPGYAVIHVDLYRLISYPA